MCGSRDTSVMFFQLSLLHQPMEKCNSSAFPDRESKLGFMLEG